MKKYIYSMLVGVLVLTSCQKEINMDFHTIDPLFVIEGRVTNEVAEVIITQTKDVTDTTKWEGWNEAIVTITDADGHIEELEYWFDGWFHSLTGFVGQPGATYSLKVEIGDEVFTSTSTMNAAASLDQFYFRWLEVMNEKVVFCSLVMTDIADEENYYCYRVYRNGQSYRWGVFHDRGNDGQEITTDIYCMTQKKADENKEEDWDDILYEGDQISVELQTIDRRTYDYLYSLALSESTHYNPIDNFSGGCLGYFAAYSTVRESTEFSFDSIE